MAKGSGNTRTFSTRTTIAEARREVLRVASLIEANGGHSSKEAQIKPLNIGDLPKPMKIYARNNGITLDSDKMYISTKGIEHSMRESKVGKNLSVTKEEIADFVENKHNMAQYYDPRKGDFIFASDIAKFVVTPNYKIKINENKTKVVNYITATRIDNKSNAFQKMIKIKDAKQR